MLGCHHRPILLFLSFSSESWGCAARSSAYSSSGRLRKGVVLPSSGDEQKRTAGLLNSLLGARYSPTIKCSLVFFSYYSPHKASDFGQRFASSAAVVGRRWAGLPALGSFPE